MQWPTLLINLSIYGGICFTLFLLVLLSKDWRSQPAKRVLSVILLHFLALFVAYAQVPNSKEQLPFGLWSLQLLLFTLGPLLYTYVEAIYQSNYRFDWRFYRRFWPASVVLVYLLVSYNYLPLQVSEDIVINYSLVIVPLLGIASLWYYLYHSYRLLRKYRALVKEEYANLSKHDLHWLTSWLRALIVLLLLDFLLGLALSWWVASRPYVALNIVSYLAFVLYIGYQGIAQHPVFLSQRLLVPAPLLPEPITLTPSAPVEAAPTKTIGSPLFQTEAAVTDWINKLNNTLFTQELYQVEDLSLRQLATAIGLTDKQLSELLNTHLNTNFYAYINQQRVAAFKRLLKAGRAQDYTLLALALECGFPSKSSFNRIFKQQTGMTPTGYLKMIK